MAITRAQQFKQMLQDGGRIGFKFGSKNRDEQKTSYSSRPQVGSFGSGLAQALADQKERAKPPEDNDQDADAIEMALAMQDQDFKGRRVVDGKTDLRTRPDKLADLKEKLRKFKATRRKVTIPGIGLSKGLEGIAQGFSDFGAKFNRPFFERVIAAERIPGLDLSTIMNMTEEEIEDAYDSYMADRLAGKTDAMGNLKPGFMRDASGNIISTGNDGREDPIIPAMAKAMEKNVADEDELIFPNLPIRILGGQLKRDIAAEGGRIGYDDGGMLVQPGFGGTRQGYRSAKAQESKQKSAQEYKASTTQQQRDDDRREFQEQRKQAVQRLEQVKPTSTRRKGIENAVRTASELNYLRNLYKLDPVGLGLSFVGNKISDFLFPPAGASELSEDELNILKATGQIEDQKQKILDATGIGSGAEVGPVPDLTDPKVAGSIAEAGGLTTTPKRVGGKKVFGATIGGETVNVPSDLSQKAIEEIQTDKRQLGLTRDQVIDKALGFDYPTSITEEGAGTIYDMVQADQLPRTLAAEGGIMDLGRQELFLGGIAKGLKKAARGVSRTLKKVAKSPIGKAAILGAIGFGIPGTSFGGLLGRASLGGAAQGAFGTFGPKSALQKLGIMKSVGDAGMAPARIGPFAKLFDSPLGLITLASLGSGLLTKKQEDDDLDLNALYASGQLNPSLGIRGTGSDFEFDFYGAKTQPMADGGRIGYQEGSKEPVAKKTMPLLDMDGQEMDLRAEGGFVPIGRMEKADDVPARLSKNEFVFTADAVRNAGDGDVDKGAEVMYNMMKNLERGGNVSDESQGLEGAREMFQTSKRLEEVL